MLQQQTQLQQSCDQQFAQLQNENHLFEEQLKQYRLECNQAPA